MSTNIYDHAEYLADCLKEQEAIASDIAKIKEIVGQFLTDESKLRKYSPLSDCQVKKPGKKFMIEINYLGLETYENIDCQQCDWYFNVSTDTWLYEVHIDWWNQSVEVS